MAAKDDERANKRIRLAKEMFTAAIAHAGGHHSPRNLAETMFHMAEAWEETEAKFLAGKLADPVELDPFEDCWAPNLPKNNPINMMSRQWGDLEKIKEFMKDIGNMDKSKLGPSAPIDEILYEKYHWKKQEVNQAVQMFPQFLMKVNRMEALKKQRESNLVEA